MVLQSGSVDITNLDTKTEPAKYTEYFKQETTISAQNLFNAATNALKVQPTLEKVVIMKQIPRYDPSHVDPMGLKPALALLFNNTISNLWMNSPHREKIFIGNHNIDCTGAIKESRYRETKSGKYDGYHLLGNSGQKALTLSVLNILKAANIVSSEYNFHQSCPQFKFQNRRNRGQYRQPNQSNGNNNRKSRNTQQTFTLPTNNRFTRLPTMDQGNY